MGYYENKHVRHINIKNTFPSHGGTSIAGWLRMENQTITWMIWGQPHFRSIMIYVYIININVLFTMGYDWIQMILFLNQIYELYGSRVNMGYIYVLDCEWGSSTGNCEYGNMNES